METKTTKNIVSNSHKFRVSELVTLMPSRETDVLYQQLPQYEQNVMNQQRSLNQQSITQTGNDVAATALATMYVTKPKTPVLRPLYNGKVTRSSQILKNCNNSNTQFEKPVSTSKHKVQKVAQSNTVQASLQNLQNSKHGQYLTSPQRAQTASKRQHNTVVRDSHQQVFQNAVLQRGAPNNRSELQLLKTKQQTADQMLKKIIPQTFQTTTGNSTVNYSQAGSKDKTAQSTQNLHPSEVSKQNFIKYGQISGQSKLRLARESFQKHAKTIQSGRQQVYNDIIHDDEEAHSNEFRNAHSALNHLNNSRIYSAQARGTIVHDSVQVIDEALEKPQIVSIKLTETKRNLNTSKSMNKAEVPPMEQAVTSETNVSWNDEQIKKQRPVNKSFSKAQEEVNSKFQSQELLDNHTIYSAVHERQEIASKLKEIQDLKKSPSKSPPKEPQIMIDDEEVQIQHEIQQQSIEKKHLHSLRYPHSYIERQDRQWVHKNSPKLFPRNPSDSKLKDNNNLLDDIESYATGDRPYDEKVLAEVVTKKEDIRFTINGRNKAITNLNKELATQKNIRKRQQVVQAYDGTQRTHRKNIQRVESHLSLNQLTERADQQKSQASGPVEAELQFGKFVYNQRTKLKGANREQINSNYYDGNAFDIRLHPHIEETKDGKMIAVKASKQIVSAFQTKAEQQANFKVMHDEKRINLNTNTVSFAAKFSKSQPAWRVRKQERKSGQMGPCIGFYDTKKQNEKPIRVPNFSKQLSREHRGAVFVIDKEDVNRDHELKAEAQRNNLRKKSVGAYLPKCSRYGSEITNHAGNQVAKWMALETYAEKVKASKAAKLQEIQLKALDQFDPKSLQDPTQNQKLQVHVPTEMLLGRATETIHIASENIKEDTYDFVEKHSKKRQY